MSKEDSSWGFRQGDEIVSGRYALQLLGDGAMCEVYLAWDDRLFCPVVAKLIRPGLTDSSKALRRLRREAEALGRLSHPAIVRCFDSVLDGDRPHLIQEFAEGLPLLAHARGARLGPEQLAQLFLRTCSALHYLERESTVHLDVKPGNIIVGASLRLIDFGLARTVEQARRLKGPVGTDAFMAPEACDPLGQGPPGTPADMWGLGATMYHAVTGRVPFRRAELFDEGDPAARFPQLDRKPDPLPEGIPSPLGPLIVGCLDPDPEARPAAAEVARTLERWIAG